MPLIDKIIARLDASYPDAKCSLNFKNPVQLWVATVLSAQCTDKRVNEVTKGLFKKYKTAKEYARAKPSEFEREIRSTGFYRMKAKSILSCARILAERHNGQIPKTMEELTALPGIGRKTANVILGNGYGIPGVVVDTHVKRLAGRLGLTKNEDPVKIEFDLMKILPKKEWTHFSHLLIHHGRAICRAQKPLCPNCPIQNLCPYPHKNGLTSPAR